MVGTVALARDIVVQKVQGDVSVRHGVAEVWTKVKAGDILRPDDTMRTGKKGSAVLVAPSQSDDATATKRITLPSEVMVDMSDVRDLSQEELMLKLTMEKVRASSYEWKNNELNIPNTTVVHGADRSPQPPISENDIQVGVLQLNGTRVLFDNGFYSTSALRGMDVLRRYPSLAANFDHRFRIVRALEKANLRGEALNEYVSLLSLENITAQQTEILHERVSQLRKQLGQ
jgi:hypothetical protein